MNTPADHGWAPVAIPPVLREDELHVWRFHLARSLDQETALWRLLSPEEARKAARFRFDRDRAAYVVAHGVSRLLLAHYAGNEPESLAFLHNPFGKPALAGSPIRFNLSHSKNLGLLAIAWNRDVGVDIEYIREEIATEQLAHSAFAPAERRQLCALPFGQRTAAFFACWTRKEAYVKALGSGLSAPLAGFAVNCNPAEAPRLLSVDWDPVEVERWSWFDVQPGEGYAGAVVVQGKVCRLRCLALRPELLTRPTPLTPAAPARA